MYINIFYVDNILKLNSYDYLILILYKFNINEDILLL